MTSPTLLQADPPYLTEMLRRAGVLTRSNVIAVAVDAPKMTVLSRLFRLHLTYDHPHEGAPPSLMLKTVHPDRAETFWFAGRSEVAFYAEIASATPGHLVPRCYEAHRDPETRAWHLLLEDLTDTHYIATQWPLPPSAEVCASIVSALARFHGTWWDHPRLGTEFGTWIGLEAMQQRLADFAGRLARFCDHMGDRLPPERRAFYDKVMAEAPRLLSRYHTHRNATIVHGDAHAWNCFLPRKSESHHAILFDWDCWRLDPATDDLAYMMALHWYPDRRQRLEQPLLDTYHDALLQQGVRGYDRCSLTEDYRWSVLMLATTPVWQWSNNIPPAIWWNNLERILLAVDDLDCRALLG